MMKTVKALCIASVLLGVAAGCDDAKKEQLRNAAHKAILEYVESKGQEQAAAYVDKLVEDGRLGAANAAEIKAAIPQGVEKLREVMGEAEKEGEVTE